MNPERLRGLWRGDKTMSPRRVDGLFLPQGATVFPRRGAPGTGLPGAAVPYLHGPFSCSRPALLLQPELLLQPLPSWSHLGLSLPASPSSILGHVFSLPGYTDFISPIFFSGPKQKAKVADSSGIGFPCVWMSPHRPHISLHPAFKSWKNRK